MPGQSTWDDVRTVLNTAALELGLPNASVDFPLESGGDNLALLGSFLASAGRALVRRYPWPQLRQSYNFNTQNGRAVYELPPEVLRVIDNTAWMRSRSLPMVGPVSPGDWQALLARSVTATASPCFRLDGSSFTILPTPSSTLAVSFEYLSRYWVYGNDDGRLNSDVPLTSDDYVWFDAPLITAATKLRWLKAKGFPTDAVQEEYDSALNDALSLTPASALVVGSSPRPLLIGAQNLPDTGWGR